jgi:hydroxypyruvate isomerase
LRETLAYYNATMRRRDFVTSTAAAALAASALPAQTPVQRKGRFKHGVMRVNFDPKLSFEECCKIAADAGCKGFDMAANNDWPTLKKYGLICSMGGTGGVTFENGLIRREFHDELVKSMSANLDACAAAGVPNMISVGGQRRGMPDEQGWENAAALLNRVKAHAEDKNVTICIEVMNSKYKDAAIGRFDQICDHVSWGVELCKRVNSPRVKILFDIYHVQIMDGNVAENIRNNIQWIGHFHTGGVPGRHEINDTQELNYRYIAKTIADAGFTGFVSHEYRLTPGLDSAKMLNEAVSIMDV